MRLTRLAVRGFRNLAPTSLTLDTPFVLLLGENGQGKTNLLEAIYVLATLRPLRGHRLRDLVRWGEPEAVVAGDVETTAGTRQLRVVVQRERQVLLDGRPARDLGEYFACIRAIAFTPADAAIVTDGPDARRAWLDRAAFTARPAHLDAVRFVQRCLSQKAATLRAPTVDLALLDALDAQLARAGAELVERRARMLAELGPHVEVQHGRIAGGHGRLSLRLRTDADGVDLTARAARLAERLASARPLELRRRMPLAGPQRDEVVVLLDDQPLRTFGSRGQVRSVVLAMKLAELEAAHARGDRPLFLLDDLSSELDAARTARLTRRLVELQAQVVVTTTDPTALEGSGVEVRRYVLSNGVVHGDGAMVTGLDGGGSPG